MAEKTKIEWADRTWSPWIGCQKVGPGCDHCYAEALNKRAGHDNWGPGAPRRRTSVAYWKQPMRWNGQGKATVFPSMCDPFDNAVDDGWRADFAQVIRETPNLTWLLLTKRIGNAHAMLSAMFPEGVPENVWIGATVVDQDEAERDVIKLIALKGMLGISIIFLSIEPMLGEIDLARLQLASGKMLNAFTGIEIDDLGECGWGIGVDQVICGGESGGQARPMHPDWPRSLRDQCAFAHVPFLFKQWGEWSPDFDNDDFRWLRQGFGIGPDRRVVARVGKKRAGRLLDGVQHDGMPA